MAKQLFWVDANGTENPLTRENGYILLKGLKGFYMPPVEVIEEEVPFQPGSRPRNVKVKSREIDVPVKIVGKDPIDLESNIDRLLRMVNPLRGDGKFKSISDSGRQRELSCRYISGFEMDQSSNDNSGATWQKAIGVFRAFDPYWYDSITTVQTFTTGETATFFPFFPLRLASSSVFADTSIDNTGDVETFPEWIITGPASNIVLRNLTTGEIMQLDTTLDVGESITINTRPTPPNERTVKKNDGTNLYYTLTDESTLWSLQEGVNSVRLEMSGSTADSSIQLTYHNRYWGP